MYAQPIITSTYVRSFPWFRVLQPCVVQVPNAERFCHGLYVQAVVIIIWWSCFKDSLWGRQETIIIHLPRAIVVLR